MRDLMRARSDMKAMESRHGRIHSGRRWTKSHQRRLGDYPGGGKLLRDPVGVGTNGLKAIRGGSWRTGETMVTSTCRNGCRIGCAHGSFGFPVVSPSEGTTASRLRHPPAPASLP